MRRSTVAIAKEKSQGSEARFAAHSAFRELVDNQRMQKRVSIFCSPTCLELGPQLGRPIFRRSSCAYQLAPQVHIIRLLLLKVMRLIKAAKLPRLKPSTCHGKGIHHTTPKLRGEEEEEAPTSIHSCISLPLAIFRAASGRAVKVPNFFSLGTRLGRGGLLRMPL